MHPPTRTPHPTHVTVWGDRSDIVKILWGAVERKKIRYKMIGFTRYITCLSVCLSYLERDKRDEILSICLILEPSTVGYLIYLSYCGVKEQPTRNFAREGERRHKELPRSTWRRLLRTWRPRVTAPRKWRRTPRRRSRSAMTGSCACGASTGRRRWRSARCACSTRQRVEARR